MLLSMKATYPLTQTRDRASNRIMARGAASTTYSIRLAKHEDEIRETQMLRFLVFNVANFIQLLRYRDGSPPDDAGQNHTKRGEQ